MTAEALGGSHCAVLAGGQRIMDYGRVCASIGIVPGSWAVVMLLV